MNNLNPPYNASDILRYLRGEMSNADMRLLELEALKDPFLQDAIDGFREAYSAENEPKLAAHLENAETYEPQIIRKKNRSVIPIWRKNIVRYATAAAIVSGTGWFIFNLSQPDQSIAPKQETPTVVSPGAADSVEKKTALSVPQPGVTPEAPTIAPKVQPPVKKPEANTGAVSAKEPETADESTPNTAAAVPGEAKNSADFVTTEKKPVEKQETISNEPAALNRRFVAPSRQQFSTVRPDSTFSNSYQFNSTTVQGKVFDADKYPLDNISVTVKGSTTSVVSDELGRFNIKIPDTGAVLVASGPGYKTREFKKMPGENKLELELEPSAKSLSEVVVSGYSSKKKNKTSTPMLDMDTTDAAPAGGWRNFEKYVLENKQLSSKAKSPVSVVLSFEVDQKGRPAEFDIIESGGAAFDKEAIRLLQAGPAWINKTAGTAPMAKITIVF